MRDTTEVSAIAVKSSSAFWEQSVESICVKVSVRITIREQQHLFSNLDGADRFFRQPVIIFTL